MASLPRTLGPLTDAELERVAVELHHELFRAGVLLGVRLAWLEEVLADTQREVFGKCMEVLQEWRKSVTEDEER